MKYVILFFLLLTNCSDNSNIQKQGNGINKSLLGSYCAPGCIWSKWAVSSGVQSLTHYCNGEGCACVTNGNIYQLCSLDSEDFLTEETTEQSLNNETQYEENLEYSSIKGNQIAEEAYWEANRRNTVGWCYNAVADAVERVTGRFLWGAHAYQAADQFSSSPHFYEVWNQDLRYLPAGAVVVWGRGTSRSGHISVSLGDGREASDHITSQMTYHYGGAPSRVFFPKQ